MNFSENIKLIKKLLKLTQEEFAKKINISRSAYTKLISGQNQPSLETLLKIRELVYDDYKITIDDLFFKTTEEIINTLQKD